MFKLLITTDGGCALARQPKNPFHPGEILLEEFLEPKGITQAALAEKLGWTKARLNELIKGKRGITAAAALDLSDALGTSPKLWMNLQATFDLDKAEKARRAA
jgi:addiction module HigA family antidote